MSESLIFYGRIAHSSFANKKRVIRSKKFEQNRIILYVLKSFLKVFLNLLIPSFLVSDVRKSLRLLTKNERIAGFIERMAHLLIFSPKNERFAQKTDERIPNPGLIYMKATIWGARMANRQLKNANRPTQGT